MGQRAILKNLVTAYGSYIHMEKDYLVLDYIDGGNLEDLFLGDPPQQTQWLQFWRSLVGAFNPLKRIHSLVYKGKLLHA
jgi:serine/threonine protein kinase